MQFNTSTLETTIDRKMLTELPILARNPFSLALLDTPVVNRYTAERNPFYMYSSAMLDTGGRTTTSGTNSGGQNDLLLDGTPIQLGNKGSYAPRWTPSGSSASSKAAPAPNSAILPAAS